VVDGAGRRTIFPHYIYVAVASAIRDTAESGPSSYSHQWDEALDVVADRIGGVLAEQNPYFDKDIFLELCKSGEES
tara:strand:+ start:2252 stop:2479 length:228 start_codon:yes stop_codon:yes gene_type:complete